MFIYIALLKLKQPYAQTQDLELDTFIDIQPVKFSKRLCVVVKLASTNYELSTYFWICCIGCIVLLWTPANKLLA